jgi:anti-sigma regulatory factor (Ser/Thr protein kinase)
MKVLRIRIPPLPRFAGTARRAFSDFAGFHRLRPIDVENFVFAIGEAIANAISHAGTCKEIELFAAEEGDAIVVQVIDRGRGFVASDGMADLPASLAEGGRGFAIMQRCTDFFDVRSDPACGTVVTLGRYRRELQEPALVS